MYLATLEQVDNDVNSTREIWKRKTIKRYIAREIESSLDIDNIVSKYRDAGYTDVTYIRVGKMHVPLSDKVDNYYLSARIPEWTFSSNMELQDFQVELYDGSYLYYAVDSEWCLGVADSSDGELLTVGGEDPAVLLGLVTTILAGQFDEIKQFCLDEATKLEQLGVGQKMDFAEFSKRLASVYKEIDVNKYVKGVGNNEAQ